MNHTLRQTSDALGAEVVARIYTAMQFEALDLDHLAARLNIPTEELDDRLANPRLLRMSDLRLIAAALGASVQRLLGDNLSDLDPTVPAWVTHIDPWADLGTPDAFRILARHASTTAGTISLTQTQRPDGTLGYLALDLSGVVDVVITDPDDLRNTVDGLATAIGHLVDAYEDAR